MTRMGVGECGGLHNQYTTLTRELSVLWTSTPTMSSMDCRYEKISVVMIVSVENMYRDMYGMARMPTPTFSKLPNSQTKKFAMLQDRYSNCFK